MYEGGESDVIGLFYIYCHAIPNLVNLMSNLVLPVQYRYFGCVSLVLDRVKNFLPEIKKANHQLQDVGDALPYQTVEDPSTTNCCFVCM